MAARKICSEFYVNDMQLNEVSYPIGRGDDMREGRRRMKPDRLERLGNAVATQEG